MVSALERQVSQPRASSAGNKDLTQRTGTGGPDYFFRCNYCIKLIAEDLPVYMRHDHCYCSQMCRDKGMSRLYSHLKETQLHDASLLKLASGMSLATSGQVKSDSSLASRTTLGRLDDIDGGRLGPLARLGQRVIDAMLQRVASQTWGVSVLRTYSSGMLWGREFTKNSSVAPLFSYLPEVDQYIAKTDSFYSKSSERAPSSSENFDSPDSPDKAFR